MSSTLANHDITKLVGISPWLKRAEIEERIWGCIKEAEGLMHELSQPEVLQQLQSMKQKSAMLIDDSYIGNGYGKITMEAKEAIQLVAQTEGILLDHVYTGKAMAGLIDYIKKGLIAPHEKVLFWHTGGAPGLLAIQDEWV